MAAPSQGALPVAMDLMTVSAKASLNTSPNPPPPSENSSSLCEVLCAGENADAFFFICLFVYLLSDWHRLPLDVQRAARKKKKVHVNVCVQGE